MRGSTAEREAGTAPNRRVKLAAGAALLGLLAITALSALRSSGEEKPRSPAPGDRAATREPQRDPRELAALNQDFELVRARVRGLEERVSNLSEPAAIPALAEAEEPPAEPVALDAATMRARYDEILEQEPFDGSWARAEERVIQDFVNEARTPGTRLESVECRSTLCRVRFRIESRQESAPFRARIGWPPLGNGGFLHIDDAAGTMTFFSARAGHPLPSLEPG